MVRRFTFRDDIQEKGHIRVAVPPKLFFVNGRFVKLRATRGIYKNSVFTRFLMLSCEYAISRVRESNPPPRLGKPLYYRYTNPARCYYYSTLFKFFQGTFCEFGNQNPIQDERKCRFGFCRRRRRYDHRRRRRLPQRFLPVPVS